MTDLILAVRYTQINITWTSISQKMANPTEHKLYYEKTSNKPEVYTNTVEPTFERDNTKNRKK